MIKLGTGIIGSGFSGRFHIDALKRIPFSEVKANYDVDYDVAKKTAEAFGISKCCKKIDEILEDPDIDVIHNCSPTSEHTKINEKIIKAGKHVFCEKPLAISSKNSKKILDLLKDYPNTVAGINFQNRMNAHVQEMKSKVRKGDLGKIITVFGAFLQDLTILETEYGVSYEKDIAGPSFIMAANGSHWIDAVQTIVDDRITEVCADLAIAYEISKNTKSKKMKLEGKSLFFRPPLDGDICGSMLFKMKSGIHGVFHISEISAGRKNHLDIEVYGTESSVHWNLENSDQMWMGFRGKPNLQIYRNDVFLSPENRHLTELPAGHTEGWFDNHKNNIKNFYKFILDNKKLGTDKPDFATFEDGHYTVKVIEAILESNNKRKWQKVEED